MSEEVPMSTLRSHCIHCDRYFDIRDRRGKVVYIRQRKSGKPYKWSYRWVWTPIGTLCWNCQRIYETALESEQH